MNIIGIDLAKNIFHVCVMNESGRVLRRKKVIRSKLLAYVLQQGPGIVALEACGGSHYWARLFSSFGYETRIMAAQFVKPFVKSNKNDEIDAEAICEASSRPQMRFVATRSEEQQDIQSLHRVKERLVKQRTALSNEIRGVLLEYGITLPKGIGQVRSRLPQVIAEHGVDKSSTWCELFNNLYLEFVELDKGISHYEKRLEIIAKENATCRKLLQIPGVGVMTATAVYAAVGNPRVFKNGRQFAAWLGLVPKQYSTGGKPKLGRISKRGDKYLRKLLVLGARSSAMATQQRIKKEAPLSATEDWFLRLAKRAGGNKAVVALANKTARKIWIVLNGEDFKQLEELALAA